MGGRKERERIEKIIRRLNLTAKDFFFSPRFRGIEPQLAEGKEGLT